MRIFVLGLLVIFLIGCGGSSGGNSSSAGSSSGTDNSSGAESKPTITSSASITLNENQVISYQISTTDNVSIKPNSYSLSGTDASYFTINSETGLITSKASGDYESKPTYEITVSVRDRSDNEISLAISITLKNLDDINPVITSANAITLYENRTIYYQMTATDNVSIKANSYTLSGTDSNYFTINSNTGLISSIVKGDYETKASYTFTVSVSDTSDNETSLDVSIILKNITDEENPRITSVNTVNLDENRTIYYQITATDNISIKPNSFTLSGADASYFAVNNKTGLINSKENGDYETKSIYAITVGVSDTSDIKSTLAVTITLNNLDDSSPIFSSANSLSLNENLTINYQISATDNISIKPNSFTLSGADASYFTIDTRTGFVSSKIKGDYETKSNYAITVGVSDTSDNASSLAIAITLINVDESNPLITSENTMALNENLAINYQITATDNIGIKPNSFTLFGADASYFTINIETGLISSKVNGDYETKSRYAITVGVSDTNDNESSLAVTITLNNLDDSSPVITSANTISLNENLPINYQITATDNIGIKPNSFTLSGTDASYFVLNTETGLVSSKVKGDFETKAHYSISVGVIDTSDNKVSLALTITLINLDDINPLITSEDLLVLNENKIINYQITATDNVGIKPNSFTLSGADASYFTIDTRTGFVSSKIKGDYETKSSYAITVGVSDTSDNASSLAIAITLINVDESNPLITSENTMALNENLAINYQITATDNIGIKPNSFTLFGADASYFTINIETGLISSKVNGDYETKSSYAITVGVSDTNDNESSLAVTITLNNLDDSSPVITSANTISLNENLPINYQITATDNIGIKPNSFSLSGADVSYFTINTETGLISSKVTGDYETKSSYAITLGVSDTSDNESSLAIAITLINVDESNPLITSENTMALNENLAINYQITATDNIGIKPNSFTLFGADASYFTINTGTGLIGSKVNGDYETKSSYAITVGVSDTNDNESSLAVTITLNNLDDSNPVITSVNTISLNENLAINYQITATDNIGIKPNSFTLSGADASYFMINTGTGLIRSKVNGDYETKSSYAITVGVSDTSDNESSLAVTITLNNLDDSNPVITSVNTISLNENLAINYQITATDNIGIKPISFTLSGADASYFMINTGTGLIRSKVNGDYETKSSYAITVGVSDTSDNESSLAVAITLTDIDENACNYKIWNVNEQCNENSVSKLVVDRDLLLAMINADNNVSNVYTGQITDMSSLLRDKKTFNQDISSWNTSKVTDMSSMFYWASTFNQNIGQWDTRKVINMNFMFLSARAFNQDISQWDISNVTDTSSMFRSAIAFNQDISKWSTSKVTDMNHMFDGAQIFNQDIGQWDTSKVSDMNYMFANFVPNVTAFNQDIGSWDTSSVTNMNTMFYNAASFNKDISRWDTSKVTDMNYMFENALRFDQPIGLWDISKVTNISGIFSGASAFNQDISSWDISNVTNMRSAFKGATAFNQDIGQWDTSKVTNMSSMFEKAKRFNKNIGQWDTSKVTDMNSMFLVASDFNYDISQWDTSKVTDMAYMFQGAWSFNQIIGSWDTSEVTDMSFMFNYAKAFNQEIGHWNISKVTKMPSMFFDAYAFNQEIGQWDTSKITNMGRMFDGASAFNRPIGQWNTSEVLNMTRMFYAATAFNQDIHNWNIAKVSQRAGVFGGSNNINSSYMPTGLCTPITKCVLR